MEKKIFNCHAGKRACLMQFFETMAMLAIFAIAIGLPLMGVMA